jgi:hypothetical protein
MDKFKHFGIGGEWAITRECAVYSRTASGKGWKSKPDTVTRETVDTEFYNRFIRSIDFFDSFRDVGGHCRAERGYTFAGYIPVKVVTVSPYQELKQVDTFTFNK